MLTDPELIQHLRGKAREENIAIRQLLGDRKIKGSIFNFTKKYLLQEQDAEDITQDAVIILIQSIKNGTFLGKSKITTFLIGIALKLCQQKAREGKRTAYMEPEKISPEEYTQSQEIEIVKLEQKKEFVNIRRKLFGMLSEKCRRVLTLASNNHSRVEIAEEMGWSNVQTAKNSVPNCRKKLRELIEGTPEYLSIVKSNL